MALYTLNNGDVIDIIAGNKVNITYGVINNTEEDLEVLSVYSDPAYPTNPVLRIPTPYAVLEVEWPSTLITSVFYKHTVKVGEIQDPLTSN